MIDVALLGIIRRWYIRGRISIRESSRRLDISRNTVRRYIRSGSIEPSYPSRQSSSALDEFAPRLSSWLSAEAAKSRKQRRTLKQIFLDLRELGYEGSYDRMAAFGRQWKVGHNWRGAILRANQHSTQKKHPTGCFCSFTRLLRLSFLHHHSLGKHPLELFHHHSKSGIGRMDCLHLDHIQTHYSSDN